MRTFPVAGLLLALTLLVTGCISREAANPPPAPGQGALASRYDAAIAISNTASKDDALKRLAVDAGEAADGEIARKAVAAISSSSVKDAAASKAALKLAKAGLGDDANAVARLITNTSVRDQTLAKLAKGEFGE
jgi:hypothetical protein